MYLTPTDNHWIIDIETDDLNATVIWCMVAKNAITKQKLRFTSYEEIIDFFNRNQRCYFVGHNIISFDAPVLNRLLGTRLRPTQLVDTFLLSSLYSPSLNGGHSLERWGERVGLGKNSFSDFSQFSEEMLEYCERDVDVTDRVFERLTKRMLQIGFTEKSCELEHRAWYIIKKQKENGFAFDYPRAHALYTELRGIQAELQERIYHAFPAQLIPVKHYKSAFRKDGSPTAAYERNRELYAKIVLTDDGGYDAYQYVEFNLGSPQQRVEKLLQLGWEPEEFTPVTDKGGGGNPKPTDKGELSPSLARFAEESGIEEVKLIATWMAINGRANAIGNWLDVYSERTGCIHGSLWLASTLRYRHDKPNTANIPAVRVDKEDKPILGLDGFYTYEARDLWTTRDSARRNLVGVDAAGIQLRVLAHYLGDPEFTSAILSSDPHTANQKKMGLPTRALTKTITYATLMGAGDKKIAGEAKVSLSEARKAKKQFLESLPGLKKLIARLKGELKRTGRITLCDGSRIMVPSNHMVIPYLLQGDESRIMKQAAIYVDESIRREKLDVLKCGDIHDEWQSDVSIEDTERYIEVCEDAFKRAGETFQYNVPIECSAKVGKTWAETH